MEHIPICCNGSNSLSSVDSCPNDEPSDDKDEDAEKETAPKTFFYTGDHLYCSRWDDTPRIRKPLACAMPEKYKNIDVQELFPDFQEGKVLRFSRIFGPGKPSSLPNIWRCVQRKKKDSVKITPADQPAADATPLSPPLLYESDEEIKFMQPEKYDESKNCTESSREEKTLDNAWRFGPARLWFDMLELPETVETYDYGFKLKENDHELDDNYSNGFFPDELFLMVSQHPWEEDVIWDGEDIKQEILCDMYNPIKKAGWVPSGSDRTMLAFNENTKTFSSQSDSLLSIKQRNSQLNKFLECIKTREAKQNIQTLFPEENQKLICHRWEDDVIWDYDAMDCMQEPKTLVIDDLDLVLDIPDDVPPNKTEKVELLKDRKDRKYLPLEKTSDDEDNETETPTVNPFNISNDEFYNPKLTQDAALKPNIGGSLVQHSIPAVELMTPYFPTFMGPQKLRNFHRPPLKQYSHGALAEIDFHPVYSLHKHIKQKKKQRKKECEEFGGGDIFFMRTVSDLSGKDGCLVLFEYSEEHPPLMMQVGMAAKIRNYYRRRRGKDTGTVDYKYGEIAYAHTTPFLGTLQPGQSLQAFENNLFRSPIYEHRTNPTDFLILRTRHKYYIREIKTIYTVGQQLPLLEVPSPKSEKTSNFIKDFLMVFIYRLFAASEDIPRRIRIEDIKKAFPTHREFSIRKRLKLCADFQRTGMDSKFWVQRTHFRLPSEDEIREMVSPEQCCAYYSMLAAEQRLKDAGYGEKVLLTAEDESGELQMKIDDEIKVAPWNTTQAFISAMKGKCFLQLMGVADPTGCGEGYSYVKLPNKPQWLREEFNCPAPLKRVVKGTDADLRRLSLSNARKLLRNFNVPDHEIKKMSRWQVIDVVRTLSTQQAQDGDEGVTKFARGKKFDLVEHQKKYKEECQRLFDLQNKVLASIEPLSSDEESSSAEDSDLEEMGKHIESILSNKKTVEQITMENEEAQRKELHKLMFPGANVEASQEKDKAEKDVCNIDVEGKILKIYRTYRDVDGTEFVRVETVRKPAVIEMYAKIRASRDSEFIRNYAIDQDQKEEMRREKRRLQDQLRRIKKNEAKDKVYKEPPKKKVRLELPPHLKVTCGACGATGHMRTNRMCPFYQASPALPSVQVAMTEEQEEAEEKTGLASDNLIKVDETKLILSKQLIKHADEIRRKSLVLKIPKEAVAAYKKKRSLEFSSCDYLKVHKLVNRKRIDPVVSICIVFESILNELKNLPNTQPFWLPVSARLAPGYHTFIQKPMDLQTMREKIRQQQYKSREQFLVDVNQIAENSNLYNGSHSFLTITAKQMYDHCVKKFLDEEEKLMQLERAINPLLDDDQVAFSFMLEKIVSEHLKAVPESWPFHKPIERKFIKGYSDVVKKPMDFDTIIKNCKAHKYTNRNDFAADVELILTNSVLFNGPDSQFTKIAKEIVNACQITLEIYEEQLKAYEEAIEQQNESHSNNSQPVIPPKMDRIPKIILSRLPKIPSDKEESADSDNEFVDVEEQDEQNTKNSTQNNVIELSAGSENEFDISNSLPFSPTQDPNVSSSLCTFDVEPTLEHIENEVSFSTVLNDSAINELQSPKEHCDNICDDLILSDSDSGDHSPLSDAENQDNAFWF